MIIEHEAIEVMKEAIAYLSAPSRIQETVELRDKLRAASVNLRGKHGDCLKIPRSPYRRVREVKPQHVMDVI